MTTSPSITERLQSGNIVSNEELHAQGKRIDSMPAEERNQLRNAIDTYVRENEQVLAQNIDTGNALLALRQKLATKDDAERGTLEKISMQTGQMIGSTADRMVTDAKDIGYHEWKNLRNPEQRLSSKIFSILGIMAAGYGLYRLAKWVKGKKTDSFFGKALKFFGVIAGAGLLYNWLSPKKAQTSLQVKTEQNESNQEELQDTTDTPTAPTPESADQQPYDDDPNPINPADIEVPADTLITEDVPKKPAAKLSKSPVATPVAMRKTKPDTQINGLLGAFPEDTNLIGLGQTKVEVGGKTHSISFRNDHILIDGREYWMKKLNRDVDFNAVMRKGTTLTINGNVSIPIIGAQSGSATLQEDQLSVLLKELLTRGRYENKAESLIVSRL